jgi:hypothetical protein
MFGIKCNVQRPELAESTRARPTTATDPKQTFTLPCPATSRRQQVPLVWVGVIGGLEGVVDITCQQRRAVLLFESLL